MVMVSYDYIPLKQIIDYTLYTKATFGEQGSAHDYLEVVKMGSNGIR